MHKHSGIEACWLPKVDFHQLELVWFNIRYAYISTISILQLKRCDAQAYMHDHQPTQLQALFSLSCQLSVEDLIS